MPVECVNHPGIAARGKCAECGRALCESCKLTFKSRPVCDVCLERIRHKLATDANAVFEAPATETVIPDIASQTATRSVDVVLQARESLQEANRPSEMRRVTQGSVVALIMGIILSLLVAKIRFYTGLPLGFLHILVGLAIGYAMVVGARDGGQAQSLASVIISAFALVFGIYWLANEQYMHSPGSETEGLPVTMLSLSQFLDRVGNFPLDWVFVLFGVGGAFLISKNSRNEVH